MQSMLNRRCVQKYQATCVRCVCIFIALLISVSCQWGGGVDTDSSDPDTNYIAIDDKTFILDHYQYSSGRGYISTKGMYGGKLWLDENGEWQGQGQKTFLNGYDTGWSVGIYGGIAMEITGSNYTSTELCSYTGLGTYLANGTEETKATGWYLSPGTTVKGSISDDYKTLDIEITGYIQNRNDKSITHKIYLRYQGGGWQ